MRVALVVLDAGATMDGRAIAGGATLHVLQGRLQLTADGHASDVGPGELVVLSRNLRERVEAPERTAFLAMVAWPDGAGAWRMEAANGHL